VQKLIEKMRAVLWVWFGSEEKSATLSIWCVWTRWRAVRTMIWCSIRCFRGSLPTTTHRLLFLVSS